jgi:hypothetical protein
MLCRLFLLLMMLPMSPLLSAQGADPDRDARFAELALACVQREYPNLIHHVMAGDADVAPPRELTPAFYGCYDWHSAVHGHWLLVRLTRLNPDADYAAAARIALAANLTADALQREADYIAHPDRAGFERPYGLAWLLQLVAELEQWDDAQARQWREHLRPLETVALRRLNDWLPKLHYPIRGGEHSQTAFAFGLLWDYALTVDGRDLQALLRQAARRFYRADRDCPLVYEPSGHDFLSACLAEADFMRRILTTAEYSSWLGGFLPTIGAADWLPVATVTDRTDGKLAHIDGLNLSRAWMLEGIAAGLAPDDPRRPPLLATAQKHAAAGLAGVSDEHYAGGHWLASFAVYLLTRRGLVVESASVSTGSD